MRKIQMVAGATLLLALSACDIYTPGAIRPVEHYSPAFGNANLHNIALQAADPAPKAPVGPTAMDGQRAADALERYRKGEVIEPSKVVTGEGTTGSGGN